MNPLKTPNVIIVGSGRSGTSTVAGICHEDLGICMGHFLKSPDFMNTKGYYEDLISHALVRTMGDGSYSAEVYLTLMNHFHNNCLSWGAKDPWFLYCPLVTLQKLTPKLCIVTTRELNATVDSWLKLWKAQNPDQTNPPQEVIDHYANLTKTREESATKIGNIWPNVVTIDFTKKVEKEDIITRIRNGLAFTPNMWN